ncbi:MAG: phospholipid carrier-dependent glycosyltransferase [Erysipelotrichaceae bacterium]|nr:phospholipid carrier-dependent glycosyltransferase [Erysipelotrichaceae bacterium]
MKSLEEFCFRYLGNPRIGWLLVCSFLIIAAGSFLLRKKHWGRIVTITLVYALFVFCDLGHSTVPETFYQNDHPGERILFRISDEDPSFEKVYAFSVEGVGDETERFRIYPQQAELSVSDDGKNWQPLCTLSCESYMKWEIQEVSSASRYIQLSFPTASGVINELGFYSEKDGCFRQLQITEAPEGSYDPAALIDETEKIPLDPDYRDETYFDEIYHIRNAYEIANDLPFYAAVHPLLGTRLIALGISLFGMNPFAFRFFGALCSVLLVPVFRLLAGELLQKEKWADLAAFLFCCDFMHYTTGRIATLEPFSILWILLMWVFMLKYRKTDFLTERDRSLKYLFLSGLTMGIAWATKWTALYSSVALAISFFVSFCRQYSAHPEDKERPQKALQLLACCVLFFVIIPLTIYLFAYWKIRLYAETPQTFGAYVKQVIDYTIYDFTYHRDLVSTHPYSSRWYQWILDLRPIWYYVKRSEEGMRTISCFNNPLINLFGLYTLLHALPKLKKSAEVRITLGCWLVSILPWIAVERTTFAYHYYPSIPFLILFIVLYFEEKENNGKSKAALLFCAAAAFLFLLFLPVTGGFYTPNEFPQVILRWLPSWYFG